MTGTYQFATLINYHSHQGGYAFPDFLQAYNVNYPLLIICHSRATWSTDEKGFNYAFAEEELSES